MIPFETEPRVLITFTASSYQGKATSLLGVVLLVGLIASEHMISHGEQTAGDNYFYTFSTAAFYQDLIE